LAIAGYYLRFPPRYGKFFLIFSSHPPRAKVSYKVVLSGDFSKEYH